MYIYIYVVACATWPRRVGRLKLSQGNQASFSEGKRVPLTNLLGHDSRLLRAEESYIFTWGNTLPR